MRRLPEATCGMTLSCDKAGSEREGVTWSCSGSDDNGFNMVCAGGELLLRCRFNRGQSAVVALKGVSD